MPLNVLPAALIGCGTRGRSRRLFHRSMVFISECVWVCVWSDKSVSECSHYYVLFYILKKRITVKPVNLNRNEYMNFVVASSCCFSVFVSSLDDSLIAVCRDIMLICNVICCQLSVRLNIPLAEHE